MHHKSWKVHIYSDEFELKSLNQEADVDRLVTIRMATTRMRLTLSLMKLDFVVFGYKDHLRQKV
ncbi:MAG: hypothetical protein Q8L07_05180 [Sediminibacterium sp.]|nr:hypothetical protein [Sediminibacterium sp.]MDP1810365.1 hypothetical protein [Sediminibacterium sp.]MDP3128537.1 hypothetical protein [Sediminibacterium sp.]